jgi:hypothetical protein
MATPGATWPYSTIERIAGGAAMSISNRQHSLGMKLSRCHD